MTKDDIEKLKAKIAEAEIQMQRLANCDKYAGQAMSVRASGDTVPFEFGGDLISMGLAAIRQDAEARLAALKIVDEEPVLDPEASNASHL